MVAEGTVIMERLLAFRVGQGRFAALLENVLGVHDPAEIGADGEVLVHGHPVDAIDARDLGWGGSEPRPTPRQPLVILFGGKGLASTALIVDCVEGIVEGGEMQPLPALVAPFVRGVFRGIAMHSEGGRLVVDPAALAQVTRKTAAEGGRGGPGEA